MGIHFETPPVSETLSIGGIENEMKKTLLKIYVWLHPLYASAVEQIETTASFIRFLCFALHERRSAHLYNPNYTRPVQAYYKI